MRRGSDRVAAFVPVPRRRGRPCASTWGTARCELRVGHNFAHRAEVDGGTLAWENPYAPEGRMIPARAKPLMLPDGYEALLQV